MKFELHWLFIRHRHLTRLFFTGAICLFKIKAGSSPVPSKSILVNKHFAFRKSVIQLVYLFP